MLGGQKKVSGMTAKLHNAGAMSVPKQLLGQGRFYKLCVHVCYVSSSVVLLCFLLPTKPFYFVITNSLKVIEKSVPASAITAMTSSTVSTGMPATSAQVQPNLMPAPC